MLETSKLQKLIIDDLGFQTLDQEQKDNLVEKISYVVFRKVLLIILPSLSKSDKNKLSDMLKSEEGADKVVNFLQNKVKDLDKLIWSEISNIKKETKSFLQAVRLPA